MDQKMPVCITPLRELDINRRVGMSTSGSCRRDGAKDDFVSSLPVPCVKGKLVDYQKMSVDQLKKFIGFMYKAQYRESLPLPNRGQNPMAKPSWWPVTVSFSRSLTVEIPSQNQKVQYQKQVKELTTLIRNCYMFHGVAALLALGRELLPGREFTLNKGQKTARVENSRGQPLLYVSDKCLNYDSTTKERGAFVMVECQENTVTIEKSCKTRQSTNLNTAKPLKRPVKRKLNADETFYCQYCQKSFKIKEFCYDHEETCLEGPFKTSKSNINDFLGAIGLEKPQKTDPSPAREETDVDPAISRQKRQTLLKIFRNNPLPITSTVGLKLISEMHGKVEPVYPPEYEKSCSPKSGLPFNQKEYPSVTKKAILKHGEFPHLYSMSARQRLRRYQELVVGVRRNRWGLLNRVRPIKVKLNRVHPRMKKLKVASQHQSYLSRKWKAALDYPTIRLVDFRKSFLSLPDDIKAYVTPSVLEKCK